MITYKDSGVDVERGYEAVRLMKEHVKRTFNDNVIGDLGSFGGFYSIENSGMSKPVLVAGTDGVGTKLKLAFLTGRHDTVGIDCVAMCVNDVVCQGAMPMFFLDYLATGNLKPDMAATIVRGVAEGCLQAGCALIGGETAEMPGFYPEGEYDLAGFCVGMVDRAQVINGSNIRKGDTLIGLASTGVHSNGFSLVRRVFGINEKTVWHYEADLGKSLGEALLVPTRIYVKPVLALLEKVPVYAICHITGGGFYENLPRALADGCVARIEKAKLRTPAIFELIRKTGNISEHDMYNTFNMGVGMAVVVPAEHADAALAVLRENGEDAYFMGEVAEGAEKGVELW